MKIKSDSLKKSLTVLPLFLLLLYLSLHSFYRAYKNTKNTLYLMILPQPVSAVSRLTCVNDV